MPTLLERPKVDALFDDDPQSSAPLADSFRTVTDEDIQRLNRTFYRVYVASSRAAVPGAALAGAAAVLSAGGAFADPPGGGGAADAAAESIEAGVQNAITMIENVDGIALAAFGVALAPMGFMLVLRVLNMVLSRV